MKRISLATLSVALLGWLLTMGTAAAQDRALTVAAPPALAATGLLDHLAPRFRFKTRVRLTPLEAEDPAAALAEGRAEAAFVVGGGKPLMQDGEGAIYGLLLADGDEDAGRFDDWLRSAAGGRTLYGYAPEGAALFSEVEAVVEEEEVIEVGVGDVERGSRLALLHCGRCHVIDERNRFGGIGSTPSFGALRTIPDWDLKFAAFWEYNPHPSFTQVEGITPPFPPERPPHIAPVELTPDEASAIYDFVRQMAPKDLGAGVTSQ